MTKIVAMLFTALGISAAEDKSWRSLCLEAERLRELGDYARSRSVAQEALEEAERLGALAGCAAWYHLG